MKIFLPLIFLFTTIVPFNHQSSELEKAKKEFAKRYDKMSEGMADPIHVDKAIEYYLKAKDSPEKYAGLLEAYEFKGSWTSVDDETARATYKKGIDIGEKAKEMYPNDAGVLYWYIANFSRWGDLIPITEAADEGILDEVKTICEKVIELDPEYHQAGALRLLGGIHLKAPDIPFVLTWPSDEKAEEMLTKAYEIAPQHTANAYYYAKMLLNEDRDSEAKEVLIKLIKGAPREMYVLVDEKFIRKGKELYDSEF
jgi:tetratricopeptide (TPR) repeat protein